MQFHYTGTRWRGTNDHRCPDEKYLYSHEAQVLTMNDETKNTRDMDLPVMESFYTIQGEGFHQGKAAYFIRLGGCDVGCTWCDVKESWDASAHPLQVISEMVREAEKFPGRIAVVTGGEPLMH